jgi:hypothetical protein
MRRLIHSTIEGGVAPVHSWRTPGEGKLKLTERELLQQYAAAGALVNERGDILYIHGRMGQFLELAAGEAPKNILMNNLLAGTGVGTVFVDLELNITRFTPAATQWCPGTHTMKRCLGCAG